MGLQRFDQIAQVNAARWDRAAGGRPFSSHAWLAYGERIHAADRPVYTLVGGKDGRETGSLAWVRRREQLPVSSSLIRALLDRYLVDRPLVTCQTAVAGLSGLFSGETTAHSGIAQHAESLKQVLEEAGGSFLIVPFLDPATAADPAWGKGFLSVSLPPNTFLPVEWTTFNGYVRDMRRSVRKDYRRHRNQALRLQLRTRIDIRPPDPETVRRLVRAVERKHRSAPLPFLDALVKERPVPGGRWIIVEKGGDSEGETAGEIVGCGCLARDRRWVNLTALGLADNSPNVYFELMFGALAHAIESGAAGVFGGGGAYPFKERLGYSRTTNNRVLFYARSPRLRRLGAWLARREALEPAEMRLALPSIPTLRSGTPG